MKTRFIAVAALALTMLLPSMTFAQETVEKGKRKGKGRQAGGAMILKKLEAAELTAEQEAKFKDLAATIQKEMKTLRGSGLDRKLQKRKNELVTSLRKEKKGKKATEKAMAETFEPKEIELLNKASEINTKFRKSVFAMLTKEQVAKLPEAFRRQINNTLQPKQRGGKGKKNKKAEPEG